MKTKKIMLLTISLIAFSFLTACRKEHSSPDELSKTTILELKEWYNNEKLQSRSNNGILSGLTPKWDNVATFGNDDEQVFEVELQNTQKIFMAEKGVAKNKLKDFQKRNLFRLVLLKDKTNGKISGAYMSILAEDNVKDINTIHFKSANNFTGVIRYYNLDGSYNTGWHYANGKIDGTFSASSLAKLGVASTEGICGVNPIYGTICAGDEKQEYCDTEIIGMINVECRFGTPDDGGVMEEVAMVALVQAGVMDQQITHQQMRIIISKLSRILYKSTIHA